MTYRNLAITYIDGVEVLELSIEKANPLDLDSLQEMLSALDEFEADPDLRALVITGKGSVFSAGLNIAAILNGDAEYIPNLLRTLGATLMRVFTLSRPTVAAINGAAVAGGCLLACACDWRILADGASIGVTELAVGVSFPMAAMEILTHACGNNAERVVYDAKLRKGHDAVSLGLVHESASKEDLLAAAVAKGVALSQYDRRAYALAKSSLRRASTRRLHESWAQLLDREVTQQWLADVTQKSLRQLIKPKQ
jgi:enoyl-CoA hydratase/carnithine racemase